MGYFDRQWLTIVPVSSFQCVILLEVFAGFKLFWICHANPGMTRDPRIS